MKTVLAATKSGAWSVNADHTVSVAGHTLAPSEYSLKLKLKEGVAGEPLPGNDALVVLDVIVTPELKDEGTARDLIRLVQQARKSAGLHVADHISLCVEGLADLERIVTTHEGYIKEQVLADGLAFGPAQDGWHVEKGELTDSSVTIALQKV
jgi:isoleucyl-tRNA synthetase